MSDDDGPTRHGTVGATGKRVVRQCNWRIDVEEYPEYRRRLNEDGLYFQSFVDMCVDAYIARDPEFMRFIERKKGGVGMSRRARIKVAISRHGRASILDEIERLKGDGGEEI